MHRVSCMGSMVRHENEVYRLIFAILSVSGQNGEFVQGACCAK